jgi:hypothetical protein
MSGSTGLGAGSSPGSVARRRTHLGCGQVSDRAAAVGALHFGTRHALRVAVLFRRCHRHPVIARAVPQERSSEDCLSTE